MTEGGRAAKGGLPWRPSRVPGQWDPAETVARVALAKRDVLLRVYQRRLRREDLEDCYSQATLELVARARRGGAFASAKHVSNALEQKFASRVNDRHRAMSGRSATETALAGAVSLDGDEPFSNAVADRSAEVADRVAAKEELERLREVADELTSDQRLVLACQIGLGMDCVQFCRRYGWSAEKYRKVAQRARAKLRQLTDEYEAGGRCHRLEGDILAYASGVASASQAARAGHHLSNCKSCAHDFKELRRAAERIVALLPPPLAAGPLAKVAAAAGALRHIWPWAGRATSHPDAGVLPAAGSAGAAVGAGGSTLGIGALKAGFAAACLAGAAGGYAVCTQAGLIPGAKHSPSAHHLRARMARTHASSRIAQAAGTAFAARERHGLLVDSPAARRSSHPGLNRPGQAPGGHKRSDMRSTTDAARREFGFEGSRSAPSQLPAHSAVGSRARTASTRAVVAHGRSGSGGGTSSRRTSRAAAREFGIG